VGFWVAGAIANHSLDFWYLVWNLFLAWLPVIFVGWLLGVLRRWPWLNWRPVLLTILWLGFLPNSFYLLTDFIHLQQDVRADILYDTIMLESFVISGFLLGYLSLYLVHGALLKRVQARTAGWLVGLTILLCSFAIYLGRDLRLNSWDILVNPARLLFSVTDPFFSPSTHSQAFTTTLIFFILLGSLYFAAWRLAKNFAKHNHSSSV
jgi:uncharacterized membrane protein